MEQVCCLAELTKVSLVQDLSSVLLVAGIVAALFHFLGWPKVIGYMAAGALLHLEPLRSLMIANEESINVLANLGVIFLMLNLGLDLNVRKLRKSGGTVFPAAVVDLGMMLFYGYALGRYVLGWGLIPSLFMGGVICDSSTTLLAKSLAEMKCEKEKFASVIFGTTISEDVLTIGVMAVLTGLALTGRLQAGELASQLGLLGLFLAGVMIFGLLLLPRLLNRLLSRLRDDETMLLIIMGVCFGIALIAEKMLFSLALGAFLVGAVVGESKVRQRVVQNLHGVRSIFSAVFFVTVGMMVDLGSMWANRWCILLFVAVVLVGKTLNCATVAYLTGQSFRESLQIGIGLAQIGDFAYLVALMGMTLQQGASPYPEMYQIAVGVSILTTLVNPWLLRGAGPAADWLLAHLPRPVSEGLASYTCWMGRVANGLQLGERKRAVMRQGIFLGVSAVLLGVVFMVGDWLSEYEPVCRVLPRILRENMGITVWGASHVVVLPLLVAGWLAAHRLALIVSQSGEDGALELPWRRWQAALRRLTGCAVLVVCFGALLLEYLYLSAFLFWNMWVALMALLVLALLGWLFWDYLYEMVLEAQQTLQEVMTREEVMEEEARTLLSQREFQVGLAPGSGAIGATLRRLGLRQATGAMVTRIVREDGTSLEAPGPDVVLAAGDVLYVLGERGTEAAVEAYLQAETLPPPGPDLVEMPLPETSGLIGLSLKQTRLRNETGATVVAIRHANGSVTSAPGAEERLTAGDVLQLSCAPEDMARVRSYLARREAPVSLAGSLSRLLDVHVEQVTMPVGSSLCGRTLAELQLRNTVGVVVAGIVRSGQALAELPGPETVMLPGDVVSFMGTSEQLATLRERIGEVSGK